MADAWGDPSAPAGDDWGSGDAKSFTATATNQENGTQASTPNDSQDTITMSPQESLKKVAELGWVDRVPIDYEKVLATQRVSESLQASIARYEWKEEYGDVGPRDAALEEQLFGGIRSLKKGAHMEGIDNFRVDVRGPSRILRISKFDEAGLHPLILQNIELAGYDHPTPVQQYTVPTILQGHDVVAIAQTGSGKTAAYLIPVCSRLMGKAKKLTAPRPNPSTYDPRTDRVKAEPLVLIVVPTRELALQIYEEASRMCYRSMLRPCVCYGGSNMAFELEQLGRGCDILVATPGRLIGWMEKPHVLSLNRLKHTIIDEVDEMFKADWEVELKKIMTGGDMAENADHTYTMFSATFPKQLRKLASEYLVDDHFRITVGRIGSSHKNIRQNIIEVSSHLKEKALLDLLLSMKPTRTIIFCNSRKTVDILDAFLYQHALPVTSIHSERSQMEREDAFRGIKTGKSPILVATGVSARGWDIPDVTHVINFDLPSVDHGGITEYTHRIGRTARMGHQGLATSFYNKRNEDIAQDLVNTLIECECDVPEFLSYLKPQEGEALNFNDDSEGDDEEVGGADIVTEDHKDVLGGWVGAGAEDVKPSNDFKQQAFQADGTAGVNDGW